MIDILIKLAPLMQSLSILLLIIIVILQGYVITELSKAMLRLTREVNRLKGLLKDDGYEDI